MLTTTIFLDDGSISVHNVDSNPDPEHGWQTGEVRPRRVFNFCLISSLLFNILVVNQRN